MVRDPRAILSSMGGAKGIKLQGITEICDSMVQNYGLWNQSDRLHLLRSIGAALGLMISVLGLGVGR